MRVMREYFDFPSSNGEDTVKGVRYLPEGMEPVGIVQFSHGMVEHIGRYENVMIFLAQHGFAAYGHDHLGHGATAPNADRLGYFAGEDGGSCLVEDVRQVTELAKKEFPGLPVTLVGHSMGSLVARLYCLKYGDGLARAVFVGTPAKNGLAGAGVKMAKAIEGKKDPFYRSALLEKLTLGAMNRGVRKPKTPKDWLSRDAKKVAENLADPLCNFVFTASAFSDLYQMTIQANSDGWFAAFPKDLPVYLLAGDADPVGRYGKGVQEIYQKLLDAGVKSVWIKRYPGARHELFQEINRQEVLLDLLEILSGMKQREDK